MQTRRRFLKHSLGVLGAGSLAQLPEIRASAAADLSSVDVIFYRGKIITGGTTFGRAEALAVRSGNIVAIGSNDEIQQLATSATRKVDLEGKTVMPGIYDGHIHLNPGPGTMIYDWSRLRNAEELYAALRQASQRSKQKDEWIYGWITNFELPTRWELDKAVSGQPVVLTRTAHLMSVNSAGLEKARITEQTPDPPGGKIVRDENGRLTGELHEVPAWNFVLRVLPPFDPGDEATVMAYLKRQLQNLLSLGITTANVAGLRLFDPWSKLGSRGTLNKVGPLQRVYAEWGNSLPRLRFQIRLWPGYEYNEDPAKDGATAAIKDLEGLGLHTGFGNDRFKLGAVKLSIDGRGGFRIPPEVFYTVARRAHELNWQMGIHASGQPAIKVAVESLEKILKERPRANHRHYLHHASTLPPAEILKKMASLQLSVNTQPQSVSATAPPTAGEPIRGPYQTYVKNGIPVSFGTDVPTWEILGQSAGRWDPFFGMWAAVTRKGTDGTVSNPEERITAEEAIRDYTLGPAYLNFDESRLGSLEVGKAADMVVLNEDILSVEPDRIKDIKAEKTIVAGRILYSTDGGVEE
ncbi:MAG: amidohydrolase [Acidobacteria bacterium]|nr:amidohydrolase [Acidobacteriota bacterium]